MIRNRILLEISPAATERTKDQADYYRVESGPTLAKRWRSAVNDAIRGLKTMPERGTLCNFRLRSLSGLRWIPIDGFPQHLVFYLFDPQRLIVLIVAVLHGARDLEIELTLNSSRT